MTADRVAAYAASSLWSRSGRRHRLFVQLGPEASSAWTATAIAKLHARHLGDPAVESVVAEFAAEVTRLRLHDHSRSVVTLANNAGTGA